MPLTKGYTSAIQSGTILGVIRTALAGMALQVCGRGRFEIPPTLPAVVLLGPQISVKAMGVGGVWEAAYQWTAIYLRRHVSGEDREYQLQSAADTIMGEIADALLSIDGDVEVEPEDMPTREYAHSLNDLLERLEAGVDPAIIVFTTRSLLRK